MWTVDYVSTARRLTTLVATTESLSRIGRMKSFRPARRITDRVALPLHAWVIWSLAATLSFVWGVIVLGIAVALSESSPMWWMVLLFGTIPAVAVLVSVDRVVKLFTPRDARMTETNGAQMSESDDGPAESRTIESRPIHPLQAADANGNGRALLVDDLTDREREVLALLSTGRTNSEIASELFVANGTIKSHVNSICRKLGARNRTEAVARAREFSLVQ
jgi:DNA-binding CsgD family transcriptional regulator